MIEVSVLAALKRSLQSDRVTEGSEEIRKRKVAGFLFGYMGAGKH